MLCRFVLNLCCDRDLTDLSARLISIFRAQPRGRPTCLSHLGQVKVVPVAIHEVDEMMRVVITEVKINKAPYSAWHSNRSARLV